MLNSDVFFMFYLLAREYTARGSRYIRGKLIELTGAGIYCEGEQVYSREINWNTSGLDEIAEFRCILFWRYLAI